MPLPPTYPGVYVEEVPSGMRAIEGVATSITAFVGRAERGPTETPVPIASFGDFDRTFGGLWTGSVLGFAVRDYFANGGTAAIVVRLYRPANGQPAKASLAVGDLELVAADEGAWGNALRARVDFDTRPVDVTLGETATSLFNLFVRDGTTGVVEEHRDVVVSPADHPRMVTTVLERESRLVRVGAIGRRRPKASANAVDARKTVWDDNTVPTNATVTTAASDGRALHRASFVGAGTDTQQRGLFALEHVDLFNLLVIPPHKNDATVDTAVVRRAASYCEQRRAVHVVDSPPTWSGVADVTAAVAAGFDSTVGTSSANAAVYFPRLRQPNPLRGDQIESFPAAGAVAGVIARTDAQRGVWKAPAGLAATLLGVTKLAVTLSDADVGQLNPTGVNSLRSVPGAGTVVWGARTMQGTDQHASEWKYLAVRRTALFIEESLLRGTRWVVFEPNDEPLWAQIRTHVDAFMNGLFRRGAFPGTTPRDAYFVRCDQTTTTQADIDGGAVNIHVGFAPLTPAEFVVVHLRQLAGRTPLAERIEPTLARSDLALSDTQTRRIREISTRARHLRVVDDRRRGVNRSTAGPGLTALFVGESSTAKSSAAEALAADLGVDLLLVDLSAVVSKYIGETEKNLRRLFDAAEAGGAVLLFDEADALFGRRTEGDDEHDRHANLEVGHLLQQQLESHRVLAILTTNRRANIDPAFLRRLRFVVEFPSDPDET